MTLRADGLLDPGRHDEDADKTWCKIGQAMCADDCIHCLPWLIACDGCDEYGHTDSGSWFGDFSTNPPLVYCEDCAEKRGLKAAKESEG